MARHGDGGGESSSFERSGRIEAFVLDVDVGILPAGEHGSEALAEGDGVCIGKNGVVAPHGRGASGETGGGKSTLDRGQIVPCVEDAGVFGTNRLRTICRIVLTAASAFEMSQHADASLPSAREAGRGAGFPQLENSVVVCNSSIQGSQLPRLRIG